MKTFCVEIKGTTPMLQRRMPEEDILALRFSTKTKKKEDKKPSTPREEADRLVHRNSDGMFCIPAEYLSNAFAEAAGNYKRTDSSKKSLRSIAPSAVRILQINPILRNPNNDSPVKDFEVDIKRGNNFKAGAVCVCRPRFDEWKVKFDIELDEDMISEETAHKIFSDAGRKVGLGSYRVSKGGHYGQYIITDWKEAEEN